MKIRTLAVLGIALTAMGCGVSITGHDGGRNHHDNGGDAEFHDTYVDTWLNIPYDIKKIIAPAAAGYFSPAISRYDNYLYPRDLPYDPYDLPCYVRSDFNGDGYDDFAFLFSYEEWDNFSWYLTTKMIVVQSSPAGYEISADMVLGTVTAYDDVPVEEYWSIFLVPAGKHTFTTYKNGIKIIKTVTLYNDAFYLASLDPDEEALFYGDGGYVYEMSLDKQLAKKAALDKTGTDEKRTIQFNKNVQNRERPVK
jgi:hypothetical protein